MKNISRRVFIKGMAVAAVATAASTVLAGCNVPGVTEEAPVAGFQSQSQTMNLYKDANDKDVKLTLTTTSLATTMDKQIKVGLKLVNETGKTVRFYNGGTAANNLSVTAYFDGDMYINGVKPSTVDTYEKNMYCVTGAYGENGFGSNEDGKSFIHEGYLYFDGSKAPKDWKKMTLVVTILNCKDTDDKAVSKELVYTLSK